MDMQALRILMLLVALGLGYVLFFSTQPRQADISLDPSKPATASTAHSQYKEAMNKAQAAAQAMRAERKEADSY